MLPAIICTGENGRCVVFGYVESIPLPEEKVRITNARMVLRWDGACVGLFGLAAQGPLDDTRLTRTIAETTCVVKQALVVTDTAAEKIAAWADWK